MARRHTRKLLLGCGLFVTSIALVGLLAEGAFRVVKASFGGPSIYRYDEGLGWAPIPNFSHDFTQRARNGEPYVAHYSTNEFGFRLWGNPTSDRPRIFFVGDSFTQDAHMSNESAYFSQVARMLPAEVFAVGGGGYSTLQEMLMLDRYWRIIGPTHVVVQFCSNDFDNNHYDIETLSIVRNQKNFRPYLVKGDVLFRESSNYRFVSRSSMLFRFIDQRLQNFQYSWLGGYFSREDMEKVEALRDDAIDVTRQILNIMRDLGDEAVNWYMFNCEAANGEWIDLVKESGFLPIVGVAEAVAAAEAQGWSVRSVDGVHWNDLGHKIAGGVLAEYLENELSQ
jgi:hypothetical protein